MVSRPSDSTSGNRLVLDDVTSRGLRQVKSICMEITLGMLLGC